MLLKTCYQHTQHTHLIYFSNKNEKLKIDSCFLFLFCVFIYFNLNEHPKNSFNCLFIRLRTSIRDTQRIITIDEYKLVCGMSNLREKTEFPGVLMWHS